jgi:hypothetical protein
VPAKSHSIIAHACTSAPASAVFALLKDGSTWPHWTIFKAFALERAGIHEPLGIGAIRVFSTAISTAREENDDLVPNRRLSYMLLSGFPVRNYRADVDLKSANPGETTICWKASFEAKYPSTGWFWQWFFRLVLARCAADLASAAKNPKISALVGAANDGVRPDFRPEI